MQRSVVVTACENWQKLGRLRKATKEARSKRRIRKIPADIENWIVGKAALTEYRFLPLVDRVSRLYDKFGLKISAHGLGLLYKRHGIGYRFSRP